MRRVHFLKFSCFWHMLKLLHLPSVLVCSPQNTCPSFPPLSFCNQQASGQHRGLVIIPSSSPLPDVLRLSPGHPFPPCWTRSPVRPKPEHSSPDHHRRLCSSPSRFHLPVLFRRVSGVLLKHTSEHAAALLKITPKLPHC